MVSIIVPTLNEELALPNTLEALFAMGGEKEIIVSDGGSTDKTVEIANRFGVQTIRAERGRGSQMHAGACASSGDVLWFVHADTVPPQHALREVMEALREPTVAGGNFGLIFDGDSTAARRLTSIYPLLRAIDLCYGDSGIFCRRTIYDLVGGFRPLALFEDLDLLRRLRKHGRFVHLNCRMTTSSRRFEERNFWAMWGQWSTLQVLYWCGVDPNWLARHYAHTRAADEPKAPKATNGIRQQQ
jgi:rSAM/selenodomain-associated transferase 2